MKDKSFLQQNKNNIICFIVTLILAVFTIYAVFSGGGISVEELVACVKASSWQGLALAVLSMLGFIYFEGEAIRVIVAHMGYPAKRSHGFLYYTICIRWTTSQCLFYDERWDAGSGSYDCTFGKSDYVYTGGRYDWIG